MYLLSYFPTPLILNYTLRTPYSSSASYNVWFVERSFLSS